MRRTRSPETRLASGDSLPAFDIAEEGKNPCKLHTVLNTENLGVQRRKRFRPRDGEIGNALNPQEDQPDRSPGGAFRCGFLRSDQRAATHCLAGPREE